MFKFLKEKIKSAIDTIKHKSEEEVEEPGESQEVYEAPTRQEKAEAAEAAEESPEPVEKPPQKVRPAGDSFEKKGGGLLRKVGRHVLTKKISEKKFDELFWEMEIALMENNVALDVINKIKDDLKSVLVGSSIKIGDIGRVITESLNKSIKEVVSHSDFDIVSFVRDKMKEKSPVVICFVGINGSGKTTTLVKFANLLIKNSLDVVVAAADTFRAASIQQLEEHSKNVKFKLIKHDYGSDAAAVAYDAISHASSRKIPVVLIDTAGRLHSNINLMEELKKVIRISKPDLTLFVGESIAGNDCVEQARMFNSAINIDGVVLTKMDVDERGGAALSLSYTIKKPILYVGTGQGYDDLEVFDADVVLSSIQL